MRKSSRRRTAGIVPGARPQRVQFPSHSLTRSLVCGIYLAKSNKTKLFETAAIARNDGDSFEQASSSFVLVARSWLR
eukprot:2542977-Lingulodinium_polyedra.AAC.1